MHIPDPESRDNYVAAENPVQFIEAFVNSRDLAAAGFARVQPKATGRPGYRLLICWISISMAT